MLEQLLQLLDRETRVDTDQRWHAIPAAPVGAVAARAFCRVDRDPSSWFTSRRRRGRRFPHRRDPRDVTRVDVERGGFGVDRGPAPLAPAIEAGQHDAARSTRRGEQWTVT